jgi:hypothetical protein
MLFIRNRMSDEEREERREYKRLIRSALEKLETDMNVKIIWSLDSKTNEELKTIFTSLTTSNIELPFGEGRTNRV